MVTSRPHFIRYAPALMLLMTLVVGRRDAFSQSLSAQERRHVFDEIYQTNRWGNEESRSGPGSMLEATVEARKGLSAMLSELKTRSVLDAACGDFWWMKEVAMPNVAYQGWDIVSDLIASNTQRFARADLAQGSRTFVVGDIVTDTLPRVDLVIARDVLVHLSDEDVKLALTHIKQSGSTYLLATTFLDCDHNIDVFEGEHRPHSLSNEPFNLPAPKRIIVEQYDLDRSICRNKALGLWPIEEIPDFTTTPQRSQNG